MPGELMAYTEGDLFPQTQDEYDKLKTWFTRAKEASFSAKKPYEAKWRRNYKLWMSYVGKRKAGDWRSRVFMPESFQTVETILPRLIASLPEFEAIPRGPEDEANAEALTRELKYAEEKSNLHLEAVDMNRDRLMYGTGIFKTILHEEPGYGRVMEPVFETIKDVVQQPVVDPETRQPMMGPDGDLVTEPREVEAQVPAGYRKKRIEVTLYSGPKAVAVDPFHLFPAPESQDVDTARYLIHRIYTPMSKVQELIAKGVYHWPEELDDLSDENLFSPHEDPDTMRRTSVDLGPGVDPTRKDVELLECYTDDGRVITMLNQKAIIRCQQLPFDHGQKPFTLFYDYKPPHEFWGRGEIEIISDLQDLINTLVNQRIDNVRIGMDQGFTVNTSQLKDPRQLKRRPGQVIEVLGDGMQPDDVVRPLPTTEVTQSSFAEADQAKQWSERTTGNSAYQQGLDSPSMNDSATGVALITERGDSRFGVKSKIDEIGPWRRLALQYGSLIQQFTDEPRNVRLFGEDGRVKWETLDPLSLMGAFDFSIKSTSAVQSETVKREQAISLFRELVPILASPNPIPPPAMELIKDVLESFGHKNVEKYLQQPPPPLMPGMPPGAPQLPPGMLEQILAGGVPPGQGQPTPEQVPAEMQP